MAKINICYITIEDHINIINIKVFTRTCEKNVLYALNFGFNNVCDSVCVWCWLYIIFCWRVYAKVYVYVECIARDEISKIKI